MRNCVHLIVYFLFLFTFSSGFLKAQQTIISLDYSSHFRQGKSFFDSKNYVSAHEEFSSYLVRSRNVGVDQEHERVLAEYYIAMCAIYSMRPEAEVLADRFAANHPEIPQSVKLLKDIGSFFYDSGDWNRAIKYLSSASMSNLEWKYKMGVSHYMLNHFKEAFEIFSELKKADYEEEYSIPAAYYSGVLNFNNKNYSAAIQDFMLAASDQKYGKEVPTWITSALLKEAKYDALLEYAEPILDQPAGKFKVGDIAFILGELQFNRKNYHKAAKSYRILTERNPDQVSRVTQFKLAYSLFKMEQFPQALEILTKMSVGKDSLSQAISFVKGKIQTQLKSFDEALISLDVAKSMDFDSEVVQESSIRKIQIQFDLMRWDKSLVEMENYLKFYPSSNELVNLSSVVETSLIKLRKLNLLAQWMKIWPENAIKYQSMYQKIAYNQGVDFFNKGDFKNSQVYFKRSLEYPQSKELVWRIQFSQAEVLAKNKKNSEAIKIYLPLLEEVSHEKGLENLAQEVRLSLAQSFAFIAMFDRAKMFFDEYNRLNVNNTQHYEDFRDAAEVSLAAGNTKDAFHLFDQAIELATENKDQLLYRKAEIQFNFLQYEASYQTLKILVGQFPASPFVPEANFKMNLCLFNTKRVENYPKVILGISPIIASSLNGNIYLTRALVLRAQSYENLDQFELAARDYGRVIMEFPKDSLAVESLMGLGDLLSKMGKSEEIIPFNTHFVRYNVANPDNADRYFDFCKTIYLAKKYKDCEKPLIQFLIQYPQHVGATEAQWMLANTYANLKLADTALLYYEKIIQSSPSEFLTQSLFKAGNLALQTKKYSKSVDYFSRFIQIPEIQNDSMFIKSIDGIMVNYLTQNKIDSAAVMINTWPKNALIDSVFMSGVYLQIAERYRKHQQDTSAKSYYEQVVLFNSGDLGAKAALAVAEILSQNGELPKANQWIISNFVTVGSRYFNAEGLIVGHAFIQLAENFILLKNKPQARSILKSILTDSDEDEIKKLAQLKLDQIL